MVSCLMESWVKLPERGHLAGKGDHSHFEKLVGHCNQEDTGSFQGVLTVEKVSKQTKGSIQYELQGKILGGPKRDRRKLEPRKREDACMQFN